MIPADPLPEPETRHLGHLCAYSGQRSPGLENPKSVEVIHICSQGLSRGSSGYKDGRDTERRRLVLKGG